MKRALVFLIMGTLISGGIVGIMYLNMGEVKNDVDMVTRAAAIEMAEEAAENARIETRAEITAAETPKETEIEAEDAGTDENELEKEIEKEPEENESDEEETVQKKQTKTKKNSANAQASTKQWYKYTVQTRKQKLNIRTAPNGKIVGHLDSGVSGYVIERGDEWTLIIADGKVVYASTRYLEMTEIQKSEVPKQYQTITSADAGKELGGN